MCGRGLDSATGLSLFLRVWVRTNPLTCKNIVPNYSDNDSDGKKDSDSWTENRVLSISETLGREESSGPSYDRQVSFWTESCLEAEEGTVCSPLSWTFPFPNVCVLRRLSDVIIHWGRGPFLPRGREGRVSRRICFWDSQDGVVEFCTL